MRSLKISFWCGGNVGDNVCVQHSIVMKSGSSRIDCRQRKIGLKVVFRNSIESVWVWGTIVAPKGRYYEEQGQVILAM